MSTSIEQDNKQSMDPEEAKKLLSQQLARYQKTKKGIDGTTYKLFAKSMAVGGGAMLQAAHGTRPEKIKAASVTEIVVLLDESYSMAGQESFVIDSTNELIDDLKNS